MSETNNNARLETFCDGVFAIALTLLIIEIRIPHTVEINNTADFWNALKHIAPSIFAFILSFSVILITWVNHHNSFRLIHKSSTSFIYANGFLLLTVVFMPFPTALLGEYLLTDHSSPAVILYVSTLVLQALGWVFFAKTAVKGQLCKNEKSTIKITENGKLGFFAMGLYLLCAVIAIWFPFTIAIITTLIWVFWFIYGINIKEEL